MVFMNEFLNTDITATILCGICILSLIGALWSLVPWYRTGRLRSAHEDPDPEEEVAEETGLPSLSVVVFSEGNQEEIDTCVETLSEQDYNHLQIVIVCRATAESRELLVGRYSGMPNVYVTFIPPGMHNVSERKMAITVGLKAAIGDVVLTTASNIRPSSSQWLRQMARPFVNSEVEMVLGYSHMDFKELQGPGRWYRQFDSTTVAAQWIGYALAGRPYRGDGYNLAFRKRTFFEHKGYASNIFLHYGDDDLFVNEVATGRNCRVCLTPGSIVTTEWGRSAKRVWTQTKARYRFTSRWLPSAPYARAGFLSLMNWILPLSGVGAALTAWPVYWPAIFCGVCWMTLQGVQITIYQRMASVLDATRLWFAIPPFMILHPVLNFIFNLKTKSLRKVNYTWQR